MPLRRVAAEPFEQHLESQIGELLQTNDPATSADVWRHVRRIDLGLDRVAVTLDPKGLSRRQISALSSADDNGAIQVSLPLLYHRRGGRTEINLVRGGSRARKDPVLIRALADGHTLARALGWRAGDGRFDTLDAKAPANTYTRRQCRLAFLAPDIQRAILEGRQPWTMTLDHLLTETLPLDWDAQRSALGFE